MNNGGVMYKYKCKKCGGDGVIDERKEFKSNCPFCGEIYELPHDKLAAIYRKIEADYEIADGVIKKYKGAGGKVVLPFFIEHIGDRAFDRCGEVKEVVLPPRTASVGVRAFQNCASLVKINLNGVQSVGEEAFKGCKSLSKIETSAESIGANAFEGCSALTSVKFSDGVKSVGDNAFKGCKGVSVTVLHGGAPCVTAKDKQRLGGEDIKINLRKTAARAEAAIVKTEDADLPEVFSETAATSAAETQKTAKKYAELIGTYAKYGNSDKIKNEVINFNIAAGDVAVERWYKFIIDAVGAAYGRGDEELLKYLLGHARSFASKSSVNYRGDDSLFVNIIDAYPRLASREDWKTILTKFADGDAAAFVSKIIKFIRDDKNAPCALDVFYSIRRNKKCRDIIKTYLIALFEDKTVCETVLNAQFFKSANGRKFANDVEKYVNRYFKDGKTTFVETAVWKSVEAVRKQRKKRNLIAAACCLAAVCGLAGGGYAFLNAVNPATVQINGKGIITATYGEAPDLSGYLVSYKKFVGKSVTVPVTADMLQGFDPEKIGSQQAKIVYRSTALPVTVTVSPAQLEAPVLAQSGNELCWNQIEHADGYSVFVVQSADAVGDVSFAEVAECAYDFKPAELSGSFYAYVVAYSNSEKYSQSVRSASVELEKLAAVRGADYENGRVVWDGVDGADHYMVEFNGAVYPNLTENSFAAELKEGENTLTVHAYAATGSNVIDSVSGEKVIFKLGPVGDAVYKNGRIEWQAGERANLFSVGVDGGEAVNVNKSFIDVSGWTAGVHEVEITCVPDAGGIVASATKKFSFAINTPLAMSGGTLSWSETGDEYSVFIDGEEVRSRLLVTTLDLGKLELSAGEHSVCVIADGKVIGETVTVNKLAVPELSLVGQTLGVSGAAVGIKYFLNGRPFDGDLSAITAAGEYEITAFNDAAGEFDVASGTSEKLVIKKLAAPVILGVTDDERVNCSGSGEIIFFLDGRRFDGDISAIDGALTSFTVTAVCAGGENELDSEPSAPHVFTRAAAPALAYDGDAKKLVVTGGAGNVEFYKNGEKFSGNMAELPAGVYVIKARNPGDGKSLLASAFSNEVTVFYTDVEVRFQLSGNLLTMVLNTKMVNFRYDLEMDFYDGQSLIESVRDTDKTNKTQQVNLIRFNQNNKKATRVVVRVIIKSETTSDTDTVTAVWSA